MTDALFVTRHFKEEFGASFMRENGYGCVSAIAPVSWRRPELRLKRYYRGLYGKTKPDLVIVVDALASRSVQRLCTTVQITDTGIEPGAGVGNRRKELTKKTLGIPGCCNWCSYGCRSATIISDHLDACIRETGVFGGGN